MDSAGGSHWLRWFRLSLGIGWVIYSHKGQDDVKPVYPWSRQKVYWYLRNIHLTATVVGYRRMVRESCSSV